MALVLKHQTRAQFITRVRQAYRDGDRDMLLRIARFLLNRIQAGDVTDAELRAAFGLTTTQWNNLKTKMQQLLNADATLRGAVGE